MSRDTESPAGLADKQHELPAPRRRFSSTACALLAILAAGIVTIWATAGDYGVSWDENVQRQYGDAVLQYFITGGQDKTSCTAFPLRYYGPTFELLTAAISRIWPSHLYTIRHALSAAAALLTLPPLFLIGRRLGSEWIGVLAGLALAMMPMFYGHAFVNSKDIPFACLYAWSMLMVLERFTAAEWSWRRTALLGLCMGLMASTRPAGLIVLAVPLMAAGAWVSLFRPAGSRGIWHLQSLAQMAASLAMAWVVMVIPWPFAHENPIAHPVEAIAWAMRSPPNIPMLFAGAAVYAGDLPRSYLPGYLLITTPLVLLIGAVFGLAVAIREQLRAPRAPLSAAIFVVEAWLLLPVLLFILHPPKVYDGMRHFLYVLPAVALLYARGAVRTLSLIRKPAIRRLSALAIVLVTLTPTASLIHLHPYEMVYFNSLIGGLHGASGRYETDYWLTSFREGMAWINMQAAAQPRRRFTVLLATPPNTLECVRVFKADNIDIRALPRGAARRELLPDDVDYAILTTRGGQEPYPLSPVVHTVGRDGAVFCVVRAREAAKP